MATRITRRRSVTSQGQEPKAPKPYRGQLGPEVIGDILKTNRTKEHATVDRLAPGLGLGRHRFVVTASPTS